MESPIVHDISLNTTARMNLNDSNDCLPVADTLTDSDPQTLPFDLTTIEHTQQEKFDLESISIGQLVSYFNFDIPQNTSLPSLTLQQQYIYSNDYSPIDEKYESNIRLSFINPPESFYHVRYACEVTNSPINGNTVNTRTSTKRNISGRYLRGTHGRYVTIALPSMLDDDLDHYIRVTRLTVPYEGISFIHPYPLLYSEPKKTANSHAFARGSSIYYKITKEELCCCAKSIPNMILTRRKQYELKHINNLCQFDNNDTSHRFNGDTPKAKIINYKLKLSILDFRVAVLRKETNEIEDTDIFCRSQELREAEGCRLSIEKLSV